MTNRPTGMSPPNAAVRVAERLLVDGRIRAEDFHAAVGHMKRVGGRIEEALLDIGAIAELDLLKYLAALHKTRFVSTEKLAKADIDKATLERVPRKVAERYLVVPVVFDAATNALSVITADPENVEILDDVRKATGVREVRPLVARPAAVRAALSKFYGGEPYAFAALERRVQDPGSMMTFYGRNVEEVAPTTPSDAGSRERVFSAEELQTGLLGTSAGAVQGAAPAGGPPSPRESSAQAAQATPQAAPVQPTVPVAVPSQRPSPAEVITASEPFAETLKVMVSLLENGRQDLRGHSSQVARLAKKLGERVGLSPADTNAIAIAAYLHDLGKMAAYHLTALNVAEYDGHRAAAMKSWATPLRLMEAIPLVPATALAIENLYERFDGNGIPNRKAGRDIPLGARLLAVVDTYADLTQNPRNPFRKTLKPVEACQALDKYKGTVFDPHLLDLFRANVAGDDLRARILSNRHVALLVDPDPEDTTVLELRLIEEGIEVRLARNADQALELLAAGDIELVVSEIDLTPRDGFALLAEARSAPWGRDLPWLVLTRQKGRAEAQRAFELGIVDYVLKPAAPEVLVAKLRQALERRATSATASPTGISGSLAEMSLPDLVQVLWHGRKSGRLRVRRGADAGEMHFLEGMVVNATWGALRAEEAVYAMVTLTDGEFGLDPQFKPQDVAIHVSPEALLLEGMRRMDEGGGSV